MPHFTSMGVHHFEILRVRFVDCINVRATLTIFKTYSMKQLDLY